jgi:hypothetical protein
VKNQICPGLSPSHCPCPTLSVHHRPGLLPIHGSLPFNLGSPPTWFTTISRFSTVLVIYQQWFSTTPPGYCM